MSLVTPEKNAWRITYVSFKCNLMRLYLRIHSGESMEMEESFLGLFYKNILVKVCNADLQYGHITEDVALKM